MTKIKPRVRYFLVSDKETARNLMVIESATLAEARQRAWLVRHLMSSPPEDPEQLGCTPVRFAGDVVKVPTLLDGYFRALADTPDRTAD